MQAFQFTLFGRKVVIPGGWDLLTPMPQWSDIEVEKMATEADANPDDIRMSLDRAWLAAWQHRAREVIKYWARRYIYRRAGDARFRPLGDGRFVLLDFEPEEFARFTFGGRTTGRKGGPKVEALEAALERDSTDALDCTTDYLLGRSED